MKAFWLILGIVLFGVVLIIDVKTDLDIGEEVDHRRGFIFRLFGLIPCIVCLIMAKGMEWPRVVWIAMIVLLMVGFNYLNLFDGLYNIFRGYGWFFTGSEDGPADAKTDNFLQAIPLWANVVIKIGGSLATIFIYRKIY